MIASELRLGNYASDGVFEFIVASIQADVIQGGILDSSNEYALYSFNIENVKSVELTEAWLLKFGFKDNVIDESFKVVYDSIAGEWKFIVLTIDGRQTDIAGVLYLHQLQNLYFALADEELVINF